MLVGTDLLDQRIVDRHIFLIAVDFLLLEPGTLIVVKDPDIDRCQQCQQCDDKGQNFVDLLRVDLEKSQTEQNHKICIQCQNTKQIRSLLYIVKQMLRKRKLKKCNSRDKCQEVAKEADAGSVESLDPEYKIHNAKKYALQKKNAAMCEHKKEKAV